VPASAAGTTSIRQFADVLAMNERREQQGHREAARTLLAETYRWFTERFAGRKRYARRPLP